MVRAMSNVIDARGRVPWQEVVSFHVAVVSEEITRPVEIEIVGITKPMRDDFRLNRVWPDPQQRSRLRLQNRRSWDGNVALIKSRVVASNDIPPAVGPL